MTQKMTENKNEDKNNNETKPCSVCLKHNMKYEKYSYKMDGSNVYVTVCPNCINKFLMKINSDGHFPISSITGMRCLLCGNKKIENWFIVDYKESNEHTVLCSEICFTKTRKTVTQQCSNCDKIVINPKYCGGCGYIIYCSEKCLRDQWKLGHNKNCKSFADDHRKMLYDKKMKHTCYNCFKQSIRDYMRCSGCKRTYYCSKECQTQHWKKEHKLNCQKSKDNTIQLL